MFEGDISIFLGQPILRYNLQLFAKEGPGGEKTEDATPKKLQDARKEGQVCKSRELGSACGLLAFFLLLKVLVGRIGIEFIEIFSYVYERIPDMVKLVGGDISAKDFTWFISFILIRISIIVLPVFAVGVIVAFVVDLVQVKWQPTAKPLQPKGSKLNPIKGVKKLFSKDKLFELLKSVVKVIIMSWLVISTLKNKLAVIFALFDVKLITGIKIIGTIAIDLGIKISVVYLIIGFGDLLYQKWKFKEDMKMTKQEVKDEWKNAEGDPKIKSKQRQRMQEASRRRMMQAIPQADVVITNPTHFAVAIKYDPDVMDAPYVLAKGTDFLAARIKDEARKHDIDIVENKPLARMLYYNVDLLEPIPPELYQTVAEILAVIYNERKRA